MRRTFDIQQKAATSNLTFIIHLAKALSATKRRATYSKGEGGAMQREGEENLFGINSHQKGEGGGGREFPKRITGDI